MRALPRNEVIIANQKILPNAPPLSPPPLLRPFPPRGQGRRRWRRSRTRRAAAASERSEGAPSGGGGSDFFGFERARRRDYCTELRASSFCQVQRAAPRGYRWAASPPSRGRGFLRRPAASHALRARWPLICGPVRGCSCRRLCFVVPGTDFGKALHSTALEQPLPRAQGVWLMCREATRGGGTKRESLSNEDATSQSAQAVEPMAAVLQRHCREVTQRGLINPALSAPSTSKKEERMQEEARSEKRRRRRRRRGSGLEKKDRGAELSYPVHLRFGLDGAHPHVRECAYRRWEHK
jgi:hypothetical protein